MSETGVLRPEARVELLHGQIIDLSPIGPFHGGVVGRLVRWFTLSARGRWVVLSQHPLTLDDQSEPQPDVMLLRSVPDDYANRHPRPIDLFLLVEVADTTLQLDRREKLPAYGRAGIPEVWIVNLVEGAVEVYREPHDAGYGTTSILRPGDTAAPLSFSNASINVARLLSR